jgi:hypothetical protein
MLHVVFVFTALLLSQLEFVGAQGVPENVTVDSVLTMAKEAAESGVTENNRVWLQGDTAQAIRRLGRDAVFGDYVAEAMRGVQLQPYGFRNVAADEEQRLRHERAKLLFLSGDPEAAKKLLGPSYHSFDVIYLIDDYILNTFFFHWELESGNLPAALHRFRVTDWKQMYCSPPLVCKESEPQYVVEVARAYILAGRQAEIPNILSEINDRFNYDAEHGLLADGAAIRSLVKKGDVMAAIDTALRVQSLGKRVRALAIVAEAIAGVPGLPDEKLWDSLGDL